MRACLALLAASAIAACGESTLEADFTGLEVQASYPRSLGLTRVVAAGRRRGDSAVAFEGAFAPLRSEGPETLVEPLLFVLDPELAGAWVEVELEGRAGETPRARGRVEARLRLGEVLTTTVALEPLRP